MNAMHVAQGWAELGFVDHADDFAAEPPKHLTDFARECLCREITIDFVPYIAHSPCCEVPGHGCRRRQVSELATASAVPIRLGPQRKERG